jgi:molybdenum cofactor cytidylyltransferase
MLGDMPLVTVETLSRLIAAHSGASADCAAIIPRYNGLRGNLALLRRSMFCDVVRLVGDKGAGPLFACPAPVEFLDVDDPGVVTDIDTPEYLTRLGRP